MKIIYNMLLG